MSEPMLLSKAVEDELDELFKGRPEPQKTRCRLGYLQAKIEARQRMQRDVPDHLFVLQAKLRERSNA